MASKSKRIPESAGDDPPAKDRDTEMQRKDRKINKVFRQLKTAMEYAATLYVLLSIRQGNLIILFACRNASESTRLLWGSFTVKLEAGGARLRQSSLLTHR